MNWRSTEDVIRSLKLSSDSKDFNALKRELRTRLAEVHPDKNGGQFADEATEAEYNKISAAYEFITHASDDAHALIPVTQLPAIIKAVREAQVAPTQTQINSLKAECRTESRAMAHDRHLLPKIGSGVFAAICAFLFTFSGSLADHPLLGMYAKNPMVQIGLLVVAASSGFFFIMTWSRERREEAKVEWLMSDQGRRDIFDKLLREARDPMSGRRKGQFTARQVVDAIMEKSGLHYRSSVSIMASFLFSRRGLSISVAEKITEVHLLELEKRGAIRRVEDPSIEAVYEFEDKVIKSATDEYGG
jgi:ribosomal protein S25